MNILKTVTPIVIIVALGVSFYLGGKFQEPTIITETKTETTTTIDTTTVDSLETLVSYWEHIAKNERDTIYVDRPINVDVTEEDSIKTFTTTYSDTSISVRHQLLINMVTTDYVDSNFSYVLKQRLIHETTREFHHTITKTINTHVTTTRTIQEGMYFQVGAMTNLDYISPVVSLTTRNKLTLIYGYDPFNKYHTAGILIKI